MSQVAAKQTGLLIVLCGPSGVGKSTISRQLAQETDVTYVVSATTRQQRPGDQNGKRYEYVSVEEFFGRLDADEFLEYAQVYDDYYGTPKHPAIDLLSQGRDVLLEIDVQGALQVRCQYPQALMIFLLPPSEDALLQRLQGRNREGGRELTKRFRSAKREMMMARGSRAFDFMVINDQLDRAVNEIRGIIRRQRSEGKEND